MTTINLTRPSDATVAFIVTGTANQFGVAGTLFAVKAFFADFDFTTVVAEVTGDGDAQPEFLHNGFKNATVQIVGAMIEELAVGLEDIVTSASNPVLATVFTLGSTSTGTYNTLAFDQFLIDSITINYEYQGPIVGVAITGRGSCQTNPYQPVA